MDVVAYAVAAAAVVVPAAVVPARDAALVPFVLVRVPDRARADNVPLDRYGPGSVLRAAG